MTKRNPFLDIVKAACILFVIITHDKISESFRLKTLFPFWINMAVPMFMIISGYVYAISFERNKISEIHEAYALNFIMPKFIRYTVPFILAYLVELADEIFIRHNYSVASWIFHFFNGGIGPGSYYYPVLLQFLFIYPVIYFVVRRYDFKGLLLCFAMNAVFEFFQRVWGCGGGFYRMLMFRYIFVIAFGSWLYQRKEKTSAIWKIFSFAVGVIFIILYCYLKVKPKIIIYWTATCFLACLYLLPIADFLITKTHISCKPAELLGKASFNIFLSQMVYFNYMVGFVRKIIPVHIFQLLAHIGICVISGLLFYFIEQKITKWVLKMWRSEKRMLLKK